MMKIILLVAAIFGEAVVGQILCETSRSLCEGLSVVATNGECMKPFLVCEDFDPSTESFCDSDALRCGHVAVDDAPVACSSDCEPDCSNKECGEDGCGGFCGSCATGSGCSNYTCVAGQGTGSCLSPINLGNQATETVIDTDTRISIVTTGDTSQSVHIETPSCNTLTASPELIFRFVVPAGRTYGYDFQLSGYDTVIQLMKDDCGSSGNPGSEAEPHIINCNDDGTPPGSLGSHIFGEITEGEYFVMVDGYSTTDLGPFELTTLFVNGCVPLCDGNFCGDDQCGGTCGSCADGETCNLSDNRCYISDCQPQCSTRECGEDGCGGSCGKCQGGLYCLGDSITTEDGSIPPSTCESFPVCDHFNPVCSNCSSSQICGSDCNCYDSLESLADLVVIEKDMLDEMFLQDVMIPESSCALVEGCVTEPGLRRLLRFTSTVLNQGRSDLNFPEPKDRPDLFEFGPCHQHYHFKSFAEYTLFAEDGKTVVLRGRKYAYCMEDTARYFDGVGVSCDKVYDCGFQGIQSGWVDQYGWSLDCSWIDITGLTPGNYVLEIKANPTQVFPEVSFANNVGRVRVTIPGPTETVSVAQKLQTAVYQEDSTSGSYAGGWGKEMLVFAVAFVTLAVL